MSYLYTYKEPTQEEIQKMEIAMDNCYLVFDPKRSKSREHLIKTIDGEIFDNYYIVLFISNTCELFDIEYKINCEMMSKLGKYLREYKCVPKREKLFKQLSSKIRELCLSFIPLKENGMFYEIWSQLLEFAEIQRLRDLEDGTYFRELEIVPNKEFKEQTFQTETETENTYQTETDLNQTIDFQSSQNIIEQTNIQQVDENGMLINNYKLEKKVKENFNLEEKEFSDSEIDSDIKQICSLVASQSLGV